jgi:hypothetical protein
VYSDILYRAEGELCTEESLLCLDSMTSEICRHTPGMHDLEMKLSSLTLQLFSTTRFRLYRRRSQEWSTILLASHLVVHRLFCALQNWNPKNCKSISSFLVFVIASHFYFHRYEAQKKQFIAMDVEFQQMPRPFHMCGIPLAEQVSEKGSRIRKFLICLMTRLLRWPGGGDLR